MKLLLSRTYTEGFCLADSGLDDGIAPSPQLLGSPKVREKMRVLLVSDTFIEV